MQAELQGLTEEQAVLLLKARAAFVRDGVPARETIAESGLPEDDQELVARRLAPGVAR